MPQSCSDWLDRIKAVEREYAATRVAIERLLTQLAPDPGILGVGRRPRDLKAASENLEGTYLIRMFAEFETGVRSFRKTIKKGNPPVKNLIDDVGAKRTIPDDVIQAAHRVRVYRNALVHERDEEVETVPISDSSRFLCTYFARLPIEW